MAGNQDTYFQRGDEGNGRVGGQLRIRGFMQVEAMMAAKLQALFRARESRKRRSGQQKELGGKRGKGLQLTKPKERHHVR